MRVRRHSARLGLLLLPASLTLEIFRPQPPDDGPNMLVIREPSRLEAGPEFPGLVIDLKEIWVA